MSDTPAYGKRICDHDAKRASLDAFATLTTRHCMQPDGDGGWLLLGNCLSCGTTLAVAVSLARGSVAHGEIDLAEMDAHAKEVIR